MRASDGRNNVLTAQAIAAMVRVERAVLRALSDVCLLDDANGGSGADAPSREEMGDEAPGALSPSGREQAPPPACAPADSITRLFVRHEGESSRLLCDPRAPGADACVARRLQSLRVLATALQQLVAHRSALDTLAQWARHLPRNQTSGLQRTLTRLSLRYDVPWLLEHLQQGDLYSAAVGVDPIGLYILYRQATKLREGMGPTELGAARQLNAAARSVLAPVREMDREEVADLEDVLRSSLMPRVADGSLQALAEQVLAGQPHGAGAADWLGRLDALVPIARLLRDRLSTDFDGMRATAAKATYKMCARAAPSDGARESASARARTSCMHAPLYAPLCAPVHAPASKSTG